MKKVVSATLAGALAVGMVPAMALADEAAPEVVADDALELLTLDPIVAFNAGELSAAKTNAGVSISDLDEIEFKVADGKAQYVIPTEVQPEEGKAVDVTDTNSFELTYYKAVQLNTDGTFKSGTKVAANKLNTDIVNPGKYAVEIKGKGEYAGAKIVVLFNIVAESLKGAVAYEVNAKDASDISDTKFVYNNKDFTFGETKRVNFALNGVVLEDSQIDSVEVIQINKTTGVSSSLGNKAKAAGDYVLKVTGADVYAGSVVEIPFTIDEFDLAEADIYIPNKVYNATYTAPAANTGSIKGTDATLVFAGANDPKIKYISDNSGSMIPGGVGEYTYELYFDETEADIANYTGSQMLSFIIAEKNLDKTYLYYGGKTNPYTDGGTVTVDYSAEGVAVDLSKFAFTSDNSGYDKDEALKTVAVAYKKNADGSKTEVSDISAPGTYEVEVSVDAEAAKYKYSSNVFKMTVVVKNGVIDANDIVVTYDGSVKDAITKTYDGKDAMDLIQVKVKTADGSKVLTAGTDYNYTIKNGKGDVVTKIVDADTYTLTIADGAYDIVASGAGDDQVVITVSPIGIVDVRVADQITVGTDTGLPFTGSEIVPSYEYYAQAQIDAALAVAKVKENNASLAWPTNSDVILKYMEWVELPADIVATLDAASEPATVAEPKNGKVDMVGTYKMNLTVPVTVVNYAFDGFGGSVQFKVINSSLFKDVKASDWFAVAVTKASTHTPKPIMNGIGGGLFDPYGTVTRGMAACILFNISGQTATATDGKVDFEAGFVTPFADVEPGMWYAEAVAWAEKADMVNGWTEDGELVFAPDQKITREQWACFLANYAKATGTFKAPAADALAGFADAGKVSSWAKESVAWAVENGIMGNGGKIAPKDTIIRAEAAAMAVNADEKQLV